MKLTQLYEDANFDPTGAIPVSKAEFIERASGVNTPPLPNSTSDKSGNQGAVAAPTVRLGDNPALNSGLTQKRAEKFFNAPNAPPEAKTGYGGKSTIGQQPKVVPGTS